VKGHLVIVGTRDLIEVPIPALAGIDAELGGRLVEQHVPCALDVLGGKRLPVVPADPAAQPKRELFPVRAPDPAFGEIRHDRLERVPWHVLVEQHQIVEHRHHRCDGGNRHFLEG
jgi:hypothetical protein